MNNTTIRPFLKIWQQNSRKSLQAQLETLHDVPPDTDIICLQEPYLYGSGLTAATPGWRVIYPHKHRHTTGQGRTRAVILMNQKLTTNTWEQITIDSTDITAVRIKHEDQAIELYNVYIDGTHSNAIEAMQQHFASREQRAEEQGNTDELKGFIWLGDFNRHHPLWEPDDNERLFTRQEMEKTEPLLQLLAEHDMELALPKGITTILNSHGNFTRPDNVFVSQELYAYLAECQVSQDRKPDKTDHFPIVTTIEFPTTDTTEKPARNWRETDWEDFREELKVQLATIPNPKELKTADEIDEALDHLEAAVSRTADRVVPQKRPTPYARRWWTKELRKARDKTKKAARRAREHRRSPDHPAHEEHRQTRNDYTNLLKRTKQQHWEDWIENLDSTTMWNAHRYTRSTATDGGKTRIPALKSTDAHGNANETKDNNEKSRLLHRAFFYEPPADLQIPANPEYPPEAFTFKEITNDHAARVAKRLSPYKAPGLNDISNSVLTHCTEQLIPYLGPIYRATFRAKHYPEKWKKYRTVVLRKPGRADYKIPSSYRPIALLDTFAKHCSACVKENMEHPTERLGLLPNKQFGGRPGCTTTDSLHMLMKFTKDAWRRGQEVAAIFMDVKAAFPTTVIPRLIHDMRRYGIPEEYTQWIARKAEGRETILAFDDYQSEPFPVNNGLDQGCNLSPFLYRFYNADQIKASEGRKHELATNYADDAIVAAAGRDSGEAARRIATLFHRRGGPLTWAKSHFCTYEYHKFAYLKLTRKRIPDPNNPRKRIQQPRTTIQLDGKDITSTDSHKFLGIILDSELRFKKHVQYVLEKGTKIVNGTRRLSKMAKGLQGEYARRMYLAGAIPSMLYGADIWCPPPPRKANGKRPRGMNGAIGKMESIQRKAAIQATGALRTTPSDLLFAHADLLPMQEQIAKICENAAMRMATLPKSHPLYDDIKSARGRLPKSHPSPLQIVMNMNKLTKLELECIDTLYKEPDWKPPIRPIIAGTREDAIKLDEADNSDIKIYTDGSGHDNKVGAAAIMIRGNQREKAARRHIGPITRHTVFDGECVGQILGLQLLEDTIPDLETPCATVSIAVDNQASLRRHTQRKQQPGSHLIEEVQRTHNKITNEHPNISIKYRWVPGHEGIWGSERADEEAKRAAEGAQENKRGNRGALRKAIPTSKAAVRQEMRRQQKERQRTAFQDSPRHERMTAIDKTAPSPKYRHLCRKLKLPRRNTSLLTQLRTGHIPLQTYLHRFNLAETPTCQHCGEEPETVIHYLKTCRKFHRQRHQLKRELGAGTEINVEILADEKAIRPLFKYIESTRRFKGSHGDLGLPTEQETAEDHDNNYERRQWAM